MPPLEHVLVVSAILFSIGVYGVLTRRNAVNILMSVELMLNAVSINMVAFAVYGRVVFDNMFTGIISPSSSWWWRRRRWRWRWGSWCGCSATGRRRTWTK